MVKEKEENGELQSEDRWRAMVAPAERGEGGR